MYSRPKLESLIATGTVFHFVFKKKNAVPVYPIATTKNGHPIPIDR